jgi:hypothetical protein
MADAVVRKSNPWNWVMVILAVAILAVLAVIAVPVAMNLSLVHHVVTQKFRLIPYHHPDNAAAPAK